jgi:LysM repeat protein
MRKIISLICILLPILAYADEVVIRENAPDRYVVVKGDTLWDISNKFFKDPWKWPQIWGLNKDTIKDPHWIYPGNVVVLDHASKTLHIGQQIVTGNAAAKDTPLVESLPSSEAPVSANDSVTSNTSALGVADDSQTPVTDSKIQKLAPKARVLTNENGAISSIPYHIIGPFLKKPLVIETEELEGAPTLIGSVENLRLLASGDTGFAIGIASDKGSFWQVYRPGKELIDPDTDETLGYEATYLGEATVQKFDQISTIKITKSIIDIAIGDHFIQSTSGLLSNYIPRAPNSKVQAKVISIYGGVIYGGQFSVITINKGLRDGLSNGHVLSLLKKSDEAKYDGEYYELPRLQYGTVFVFRTFDKVSYALVMNVERDVQVDDSVENF